MHDKKFNPEHLAHLDRPDRMKNLNFDKLISQLGIDDTQIVADIGAGTGFFSIPFSRKAKKVYAIDISQDMLNFLFSKLEKEGINNIEIILSTENRIEIPDNSIDIAWMSSVFHELDGPGTLNEVKRILKPGGKFAILDFEKIHEDEGPPYDHRIDKPDAIEICINAGFKFLKEFDTGTDRKYGLIFTT